MTTLTFHYGQDEILIQLHNSGAESVVTIKKEDISLLAKNSLMHLSNLIKSDQSTRYHIKYIYVKSDKCEFKINAYGVRVDGDSYYIIFSLTDEQILELCSKISKCIM